MSSEQQGEEILAFKAVYVNLDTVIRICDSNRLAGHGYGVTESFVRKVEKFSHDGLRQFGKPATIPREKKKFRVLRVTI